MIDTFSFNKITLNQPAICNLGHFFQIVTVITGKEDLDDKLPPIQKLNTKLNLQNLDSPIRKELIAAVREQFNKANGLHSVDISQTPSIEDNRTWQQHTQETMTFAIQGEAYTNE